MNYIIILLLQPNGHKKEIQIWIFHLGLHNEGYSKHNFYFPIITLNEKRTVLPPYNKQPINLLLNIMAKKCPPRMKFCGGMIQNSRKELKKIYFSDL